MYRLLTVACMVVVSLAVLAPSANAHRAKHKKSGGTTYVGDAPELDAPGWDTISWTDLQNYDGWTIQLINWDPNYTPSSDSDTNGSPVVTGLTSGTGNVSNEEQDFHVNTIIASYYNPSYLTGKSVIYVAVNNNVQLGGVATVFSQSPKPTLAYSY